MNILLSILLSIVLPPGDSLHCDVDTIAIVASVKHSNSLEKQALSYSELSLNIIESQHVESIKDVAIHSPNFYQPRYGSRITSSLYVRGFGSRIDQPVMAVSVDDVPIMNKNAYDFDFYDIRKIEILRGPQGTLYGRNSNGGVMNIFTLSPYQWQGVRTAMEVTSEPSYKIKVSLYERPTEKFGYSISTIIGQNQGFFTNKYSDTKCDDGKSASLRTKLRWQKGTKGYLENITSFGYVQEDGYAYRLFDDTTNTLLPISYNDDCSYNRITFSDGLLIRHYFDKFQFSSITSYQLLYDDLLLDNDFTDLSYFTMNQTQKEHSITQECVLKQKDSQKKWQWTSGLFVFGKTLNLSAPVTFKSNGIHDLILKNANYGIHTIFPDNDIVFSESEFPIESDFSIKTFGSALFHESNITHNRWKYTFGLRIEFEQAAIDYESSAMLHYMFNLTMSKYKKLSSTFSGQKHLHTFIAVPKIAVQHFVNNQLSIYATISSGHKPGGFNTQIFSDIMQNVIMNDLMSDMGISLNSAQSRYSSVEIITYKPETNINLEVGSHYSKNNLQLNCSLFSIHGINQQITIMPEGNGTGRMMSNAGKVQSMGIECSGIYDWRRWRVSIDYGFTNAKYIDYQYNDSINYKGNHLPYAPKNTIATTISYKLPINKKHLESITFCTQYRGVGMIYWNDENTLSQPIYSLLSSTITITCKRLNFSVFCQNLTDTEYHTFYFKSVSRSFYADGTPRLIGIQTTLNM